MEKYRCKKCGHVWFPRTENPIQCPKCKSMKWNENGDKKEENK